MGGEQRQRALAESLDLTLLVYPCCGKEELKMSTLASSNKQSVQFWFIQPNADKSRATQMPFAMQCSSLKCTSEYIQTC